MQEKQLEKIIAEAKDILKETGTDWFENCFFEGIPADFKADGSMGGTPELLKFWSGYEKVQAFLSKSFGHPIYSGKGAAYHDYWENLSIKPSHGPRFGFSKIVQITWWEENEKTILLYIETHDANTLYTIDLEVSDKKRLD